MIDPAVLQLKKGGSVGKASPPSIISKSSIFPSSKNRSYFVQKFKCVTRPIGDGFSCPVFILIPRVPGG